MSIHWESTWGVTWAARVLPIIGNNVPFLSAQVGRTRSVITVRSSPNRARDLRWNPCAAVISSITTPQERIGARRIRSIVHLGQLGLCRAPFRPEPARLAARLDILGDLGGLPPGCRGCCAGCHGPLGNGGKGANLAAPSLPRAQTDIGLYKVIRYGLPETEMPGAN